MSRAVKFKRLGQWSSIILATMCITAMFTGCIQTLKEGERYETEVSGQEQDTEKNSTHNN